MRPIAVDYGIFSLDALRVLKAFVEENPVVRRQHRELSVLFETAFLSIWPGGSEYNQVLFWDGLVRSPLELLSRVSTAITLVFNRNVSDGTGLIRKSARPDFLCRLERDIVVVGEEKDTADEFSAALGDLREKCEPDARGGSGRGFAYPAGGPMIQ